MRWFSSPATYKAVPTEQVDEVPLLDENEKSGGKSSFPSRLSRRSRLQKYLVVVSVIILSAGYFASFWIGYNLNLDRKCLDHTSAYSPVLEHLDPEYKLVQFNGTLGFPSEFTGDPSPEVDAAWEKWSYVKYASIPESEFERLPGAKTYYQGAAKLTTEYGGGYIGFLEFSHQMHCLNMLRQGIHQDYYNNPSRPETMAEMFKDRPFTVKLHLQHCIEMLRQNVMCNADVGVITHQWLEWTPDPFANFNTFHKCRDIESVKTWIKEHEIPTVPKGQSLPMPPGSTIFHRPP